SAVPTVEADKSGKVEAPNGARIREWRKRISALRHAHRSWTIVIGMAIGSVLLYFWAAFPPFSFVQQQNTWISGFVNAGVFVLLALGLIIVVGFAGLLDLGYAAFFAFGAYLYAFGASPFTHLRLPFLVLLLGGAAVAAVFGIALGAPTLRLRGDYLAIVTLG